MCPALRAWQEPQHSPGKASRDLGVPAGRGRICQLREGRKGGECSDGDPKPHCMAREAVDGQTQARASGASRQDGSQRPAVRGPRLWSGWRWGGSEDVGANVSIRHGVNGGHMGPAGALH